MTCENNHFQLVNYSKRVRGRHYKPRQLLINWESPHFSRWKSNQDADGGTTGTILNAIGMGIGTISNHLNDWCCHSTRACITSCELASHDKNLSQSQIPIALICVSSQIVMKHLILVLLLAELLMFSFHHFTEDI